jgi:hypothetical protein
MIMTLEETRSLVGGLIPVLTDLGTVLGLAGSFVGNAVQWVRARFEKRERVREAWRRGFRAQHAFVPINTAMEKALAEKGISASLLESIRQAWTVAQERVDQEAEYIDSLEPVDATKRRKQLEGQKVGGGRLGQRLMEMSLARRKPVWSPFAYVRSFFTQPTP